MDKPISVNASPIPATFAAAARILLGWLGMWAVASGYLRADYLEGAITLALMAITAGYGIWKTHRRAGDVATLAHLVPDSVAKVK